MPGRASDPIDIPESLWQRPQMVDALRARDVGALFHLVSQYTGASQTQIGMAVGMDQGKVSKTMKHGGRQITALDVFERIADGLNIPDTARMTLGLAPRSYPVSSPVTARETNGCTGMERDALDPAELAAAADISRLTRWVTASDSTDETITGLARSATSLAASHTQVPAKRLLSEVLGLHRRTQGLLEGGHHRPRHARELLRIDADLLAHAAVIFGDVNLDHAAETYAAAALTLAQEAGTNESFAWYAQAKTARWQDRLIEAADLARQGFEAAPRTPMKTQLAWYEANAAALLGDKIRARDAVTRAEQATETLDTSNDAGLSVWSFPIERQAVFASSVATRTGDPDGALQAAEMADSAWEAGAPVAPANWAQIRVSTALAYLQKSDLDGTAEQLAELLTLDPGMRLATVTRYLAAVGRRLDQARFRGNLLAAQLRQQIRDFNAVALTDGSGTEAP